MRLELQAIGGVLAPSSSSVHLNDIATEALLAHVTIASPMPTGDAHDDPLEEQRRQAEAVTLTLTFTLALTARGAAEAGRGGARRPRRPRAARLPQP